MACVSWQINSTNKRLAATDIARDRKRGGLQAKPSRRAERQGDKTRKTHGRLGQVPDKEKGIHHDEVTRGHCPWPEEWRPRQAGRLVSAASLAEPRETDP